MQEVEVTLTINGQDAGEFFVSSYELNDVPETTARDICEAITGTLNPEDARADVTIEVRNTPVANPAIAFRFINGRRGWEARRELEAWLQMAFGMLAEYDADHGPISSEQSRASTLRRERLYGSVR